MQVSDKCLDDYFEFLVGKLIEELEEFSSFKNLKIEGVIEDFKERVVPYLHEMIRCADEVHIKFNSTTNSPKE